MSIRNYKQKIYEPKDLDDRLYNLILPKQALGQYVDEETTEAGIVITFLVVSFLIMGVLSTIIFTDEEKTKSIKQADKNQMTAIMVISWTIFISFVFLMFGATRFFNIFLLVSLVAVSAITYEQDIKSNDKNMIIAILSISSICLVILTYYTFLSRTVTDSIEYREKERIQRLQNKYMSRIERIREQYQNEKDDLEKEKELLTVELETTTRERNELSRIKDKTLD